MCQDKDDSGGCQAADLQQDEHDVVAMQGERTDQHAAEKPHRPGATTDARGTVFLSDMDDLWQVGEHRDPDSYATEDSEQASPSFLDPCTVFVRSSYGRPTHRTTHGQACANSSDQANALTVAASHPPLVERVPPVRGKPGRPRRRPDTLTADRGYDHDKYRRELRRCGIMPEIACRNTEHGSVLGRVRVEF
jgi:hypothetical protein